MAKTKTRSKSKKTDVDPMQVQQEADEAVAYAEDLERRLRDGDLTVTRSQLAEAKQAAEHAQLAAEGTRKTAEQAEAERRDREGRQLHKRFRTDVAAAVETAEQQRFELVEAIRSYVQAVRSYSEIRDAYRREWRELFAGGHTDEPAALLFKFNNKPGGSFGAVDPAVVADPIDPVETVAAAVGDAVTGIDQSTLRSSGVTLYRQLTRPQIAAGLRKLRTLAERLADVTEQTE